MPEDQASSTPVKGAEEQPTQDVPEGTSPEGASPEPQAEPEHELEITDELVEKLLSHKKVQAHIYRQAQSMKDKELQAERRRRQQQEQSERVRRMSDDEYGRYLREQERLRQQTEPLLRQTMAEVFTAAQEQALQSIEDEEARQDVRQRLEANEFDSLPAFLNAVAKAQADVTTKKQVQREAKRLEKELRESITKELTAEQAEELVPQLGRGVPSRREVHGIEAISEGFAEKLRKARQG